MVIVPYICITAGRASLFQETSGVKVFQNNDEAEKRKRRDVNTRQGKKNYQVLIHPIISPREPRGAECFSCPCC